MIETQTYNTLEEAKKAKGRDTIRHKNGLRPLHTNFINGKHEITFVKGTDDPHNAPELIEERRLQGIDRDRRDILKQKSKDGTLTGLEEKEIIKKLAELL